MTAYRILIVEDQREISHLLRTALETLEHELEVIEIPSGEEAILDAISNKIDLLVTDYRLAGITGVELMRKVRRNWPAVKVILITGLTDKKVRIEVAEAGADALFIKPVPIADFLDAVERHLSLVEAMLPPEPINQEGSGERQTLADLLSSLRQELNAVAVLLLNDRGRIQARAGDLPDNSTEVSLTASLMAIFSAGQKVSHLTGQTLPDAWHIFKGGEYDLVFAPVGATNAMLVVGPELASAEHMLNTTWVFSDFRYKIERSLAAIDVPVVPYIRPKTGPLPPLPPAPASDNLEPLLRQAKKKLNPEEVDDFWDKASDEHKAAPQSDVLSYEQAQQLGLTPKDNDTG
jgi:DNA-binding response OmpR family regulator